MAVDMDIGVLGGQAAGTGELLVGRGRREARRDRVVQPPPAVPALDQRPAVALAARRGVAHRRGTVPVHQRLAGDQPQVQLLCGGEYRLHRGGVDAAQHLRSRRAVGEQFGDEEIRHRAGVVCIVEAALGGKGVALQPVQQMAAAGRDHVGLRHVDVGVDEAGHYQRVPVFGQRASRRQLPQQVLGRAEGSDAAVVDHQHAVVVVFIGLGVAVNAGVGEKVQHRAAVRAELAHGGAPALIQANTAARSSAVMPVRLPSGIAPVATCWPITAAWARMRSAVSKR